MPYSVLVVDDSQFFKRRLTEIINQHKDLKVIATASNGREAVEMAAELQPDIITMDYEMPVLNGVSAIKEIMDVRPVPILMFSSMTYDGARITLEALAAGAVDFIPKDFAEVSSNAAELKHKLQIKLLEIIRSHKKYDTSAIDGGQSCNKALVVKAGGHLAALNIERENIALKSKVKLLVISASTGGPVALATVLEKLPKVFSIPILLVQHMPEQFTKAFAERLNKLANISVKEAEDGDQLQPGRALLVPGGKQLMFDSKNRRKVKVLDGDTRVNYKPSIDIVFGSAANTYGDKVLGLVMTGMGSDGCDGARLLKQKGSSIWTQDEDSCVVYGMPMAVATANLSDRVLPLDKIGSTLAQVFDQEKTH